MLHALANVAFLFAGWVAVASIRSTLKGVR